MFPEVTKIIHRFCSFKGVLKRVKISFILIVFLLFTFILFYVNDSVVLSKKTYFSTTSMLRDRYFGFPPLHKKANKVLQGGVSLPFIGSLRV